MKIKVINIFLALIIIISLIIFLAKNIGAYKTGFDFKNLQQLYSQSQFAEEIKDRKLIIQDHDLYAYAGYHYLTSGEINQVNIEHPPLGKYLIGLSVLLFKNQNMGQLFWGLTFLLLFFKLSLRITKNAPLSLLLILLFFQEKIFQEQLTHSLLDLPAVVFLLVFFLATLNRKKANKTSSLFFQGLSLGALSSIKYPTTALTAFLTLAIFYFLKKEKGIIKKLYQVALMAAAVFLLSYLPFFIKNPSLIAFYNLQLKALKIHLSHVPEYPKGQVFNVLFLNRWLTWWGEKTYVKTELWNILWPISSLRFLAGLYKWKKNILINLWSLIYLISLSLRLFFPRYLLLLLPFFYLQLCYNGLYLYKKIGRKRKKSKR